MDGFCYTVKLLPGVILILVSSQISGSETFESVAADLKASDLIFCYAGFENYGVTATSAIVNAMRSNTSKEKKKVLQSDVVRDFLERENLKAYFYGIAMKKKKEVNHITVFSTQKAG